MSYKVITISRQYCTGGGEIGKRLAEKLGIACYDREIIAKVAAESGLCEKFVEEKSEYGNKVAIDAFFLTGMYYNAPSIEDNIWTIQHKLIEDIAEREPCVIVGRCADYILRNRTDVMNVFLHADLKYRIERLKLETDAKILDPERFLKEKDKRRSAYVQFYTDMKWGDSKNYDITLDAGTVGTEKCVQIIADLYNGK